jgi:transposase
MSRKEVMIEVRCARQTLVTWIDMYCAGGLESLTQATVSNKPERLSDEQKVELKRMLLENKPTMVLRGKSGLEKSLSRLSNRDGMWIYEIVVSTQS